MNKLLACLALAFVPPILGSLHAQDQQASEQYEPPPPVGMDVDYYAPAKQKLSIGISILSGPRISITGSGSIPSGANPNDPTSPSFNDGGLAPDTRIDAASGQPLQSSANADSRSNSWSFTNASQIDTANNGVDLHTYSAVSNGGNNPQSGRTGSSGGYDITFDRDFGWHVGKLKIDLVGGLSMNKISFSKTSTVAATMTTTTYVYATFNTVMDANGDPVLDAHGNPTYAAGSPASAPSPGATPVPITPPYSAPSSSLDTAGNSVDNSTLISDQPISGPTSAQSNAEITEQANVYGAYFTLRGGAELTLPITDKLSASVSGGPALIYSGTTLSVSQIFGPPTGVPITNTLSDSYSIVLPACFANAKLEYDLNETTGFYAGALFQASTGYNQSITDPNGNYTTRIDFGNQEGVSMGITFKF